MQWRVYVKALMNELVCLALLSSEASAQSKLMLFGGINHDQYLGCIICSEYSSDSICNGFGKYGNEFGTSGIFNEFVGFGNEFSLKSPWNEFSTSNEVPVLVDEKGQFYGYFTINTYRRNAIKFSDKLKDAYDSSDGDLEKVRISICNMFGYSG